MPGGLEDLMVTNWPGSWESKAQACGMALSHLEHLGQDGRGTEMPTRPAIKETEDQTQGQMQAIWFSFQCHPCCTTAMAWTPATLNFPWHSLTPSVGP